MSAHGATPTCLTELRTSDSWVIPEQFGAYVLAGELAAASGAHPRAFAEFENVLRPFVEANQALGLKSAKPMRSGERKSVGDWLLQHLMRIVPGRMTEWMINRSTVRITQAAKAIRLKDYSSFVR